MTRDIDSNQDILDSRDIEKRIDELESELDFDSCEKDVRAFYDIKEAIWEEMEEPNKIKYHQAWLKEEKQDEVAELALLISFRDDVNSSEWSYGLTLIRDSHFTDAMKELCEEIGDTPKDFPSYIEIDWEATANNLQVDYSSAEFDGVTYWYRS